jgi:hypothetical protein
VPTRASRRASEHAAAPDEPREMSPHSRFPRCDAHTRTPAAAAAAARSSARRSQRTATQSRSCTAGWSPARATRCSKTSASR